MSEHTSPLKAALRDASVTKEVVVAHAAARATPDVLVRAVPGAHWMLVADDTTWDIAGAAVQALLEARGVAVAAPLVLPARPRLKPRASASESIAHQLAAQGLTPLAVGSGVVNDLVKHAAALAGKPYACIATAASMDGYAASGAALLDDEGFKRTLACAPPVAVLADLDVLGAAPARMTAWGYGDLAGKTVAGADWLLADALGVEPLSQRPYDMVQAHLHEWLGAPERLAVHEPRALGDLLSGLLVSGFAMQAHGNSRPASGSDHQFSHLWEMENLHIGGEPAAHGACVGMGCVAMLALYEWLRGQPVAALAEAAAQVPERFDDAALAREIDTAFARDEFRSAAREEMKAKRAVGGRRARAARFVDVWPGLRTALARQLIGARDMQQRLRAIGGAADPRDLGIGLAKLAADHRRARLIRRRYTVLDLLDDLGWLDRAVAELFAPGGFWTAEARFEDPGIDPTTD
jgi:glycerol-1-phosphate dehydrogenase [NAD(P)+]